MTIIDEIKEKIRVEDLIGETVKLHRSGASYTGFCPFHTNTHSPSLVVWGGTGTWKCFGTCNEGGDIFDWVQKQNPGWDFQETMKYLAGKAGVVLKHGAADDLPERMKARATESALRVAMSVFRRWLVGEKDKAGAVIHEPDAGALAYAMDRGWTLKTIQAAGIGFSGRATTEAFREMRETFGMHGIDPLSPDAVMVLGFKGDVGAWALKYGVDANTFGDSYIQGFMNTPGLIYAHRFDGKVEYLSSRLLPGFDAERKSHNPNGTLAGAKRPYFNWLHRGHHAEGKEKGAIIHLVEGQGDAITWGQFGAAAMATCGSSWKYLVDSGIADMLLHEYEAIAWTTDADEPGETVVTGAKKDFPLSTAFGPMVLVERTPNLEWIRPGGDAKKIKDVNDVAQYCMDTGKDADATNKIVRGVIGKAEPLVLLAAKYAGGQEGTYKASMMEKIMRPMILELSEDERLYYALRLADALYPELTKAKRSAEYSKWLKLQVKKADAAAKNQDDEHVPESETFGGYFRNPENPDQGWLVDMVFDQKTQKAQLVYRNDKGEIGTANHLEIYGRRYFPRVDDFVRKGVVVFPSALGQLVTTRELLKIHEEHDRASVLFDNATDYAMASFYSVFSWVYDCFNELPFLRARGGKDTGKSAVMLRIGYLCYRMAKSTGIGSTASLKHAQELYKCTIFFDEMDIADKFDERIVMLNVRSMKDQAYVWSMKAVTGPDGEQRYEPQAHNVYGPTLITMYFAFSDEATESRCITFDMVGKDISELKKFKIPRRLNSEWHARALEIRNMSLHWRMKNWKENMEIPDELEDEMVSTRANQVTVPIKCIVKDDPDALAEITATVREMYAGEILAKAESFEARFLEAIIVLLEDPKFAILGFVHDGELKDHGYSKFIRYPDLAKVVNFLLDEMNTGIEKDVESIIKTPAQDHNTDEDGDKEKDKGKKKKKGKDATGVSATTVGSVVRKNLRLPVSRHGAGYVVIVQSQSKPDEAQNRIEKLRKRFGLDLLHELDRPMTDSAEPDIQHDLDEQMELYGEMADEDKDEG